MISQWLRIVLAAQSAPLSDAVEPQAVLRAMTTVADWQLANPSGHKPYEWQAAPFWAGLYELALRSSRRRQYLDAIRRNGESIQWQPGPHPFLADDHAITQSYFLLYRLGADRRMIEPALARFDEMLQAPFAESLEFSDDKTTREWVGATRCSCRRPPSRWPRARQATVAMPSSWTGSGGRRRITCTTSKSTCSTATADSSLSANATVRKCSGVAGTGGCSPPTVRRGWSALVRAVQPSGKLGYVQRVGDQPGDTGPEQTEIYGAGAFLLAGSEVFRLMK
jgi:hypothetical protein